MLTNNIKPFLQSIEWGCRLAGVSTAIIAACTIRTGIPYNFTNLPQQHLYANRHNQALVYLCSCALLATAYRLSRVNKKLATYSQVTEEEGLIQFRQSLKSAVTTPLQLPQTTQKQLQPFDWQLFNTQPEKYPHLFIVGGTGDGKSYTAEAICYILDGETIVIHPHQKPGDFQDFPCYCGGRKYGSWNQDKLTENDDFNKLLTGEKYPGLTCAKAVKLIHKEMDARYKMYEQGVENYPTVNIIMDEYNTTIDVVPEIASTMNSLIREARKVKLRLILLIQSDLVDDLGIKGKGAIRKCFRFVRLGEFAKEYAKKINDDSKKGWIDRQKYPLLVGDDIAVLPSEKILHPSQDNNINATNNSDNIVTDTSNSVTSQLPRADQLNKLLDNDKHSSLPPLPLPTNWVIADPKVNKLPDGVRGIIVTFVRAKISKEQTINAVFGCKKNSNSKVWRAASYWYDEVKSSL
ncbi:MAG: hypothetical protein QNJ74_22415 [Trichodesmium sp. MO_231.B1]|nr:hypothetical protein [Trichodesmium sp. MO_231.B1]